jgi:hypothetical protein
MDYRPFELANEQCKPKHFGPPTALQRRLAHDAAYRPEVVERTAYGAPAWPVFTRVALRLLALIRHAVFGWRTFRRRR